jgi:glutamate synthase domain-containing protein 3
MQETIADNQLVIDATGLHYRELNNRLRAAIRSGARRISLTGVSGQRYICCGFSVEHPVEVIIDGVPGNDMAAFMNGPITIRTLGNAQDGVANTMNDGKILIQGDAGDVLGYSMRGGRLFIHGNAGYRVGIHVKAYQDKAATVVVGGCAQDFFGEYMAGGIMAILGLNRRPGQPIIGEFLATGMHGGQIFIREHIDPRIIGKEVSIFELEDADWTKLKALLDEFAADFGEDLSSLKKEEFIKLEPVSARPYGRLYAY